MYLVLFLIAATLRASYPLQLEWLEGGVLDAVRRVMRHEPVYVRPTHLWVPFLYMPLYYYAGALACRVGGLGFEPLRWLSTACTSGCFLLQGIMAARIARNWVAGIVAAGYFAALYATTGFWFDLARVDMLFTLLAMLGIYLSWRKRPVWAAGAFALAFCAKQTALIFGICVLLHEYRNPARLVRGLVAFGLFLLMANLIFARLYGPWYGYYTHFLPTHQPVEWKGLYWFPLRDLIYPSGPALLLIITGVVWAFKKGTFRADTLTATTGAYNRRWIVATTVGLTAGCFASRMHSGGSVNGTLPLDAWLSVLFGAAVVLMLHRANGKQVLLIGSTALLQFAAAFRPPASYIPSADARRQAEGEIRRLEHTPGNLYVFGNAVDVATLGKRSFANTDAVYDVLRADNGSVGMELRRDLAASFENGTYMGLVSSEPLSAEHPPTGAPADYGSLYVLNARRLDSGLTETGAFGRQVAYISPRYLSILNQDGPEFTVMKSRAGM